jgi:hypothetical protein
MLFNSGFLKWIKISFLSSGDVKIIGPITNLRGLNVFQLIIPQI